VQALVAFAAPQGFRNRTPIVGQSLVGHDGEQLPRCCFTARLNEPVGIFWRRRGEQLTVKVVCRRRWVSISTVLRSFRTATATAAGVLRAIALRTTVESS
jgi:hypothetical protein